MDFVFTLHSHLPYVLNHGRWPHGSDWICEAAADTYLPLLETFRRLGAEDTPAPVTIATRPFSEVTIFVLSGLQAARQRTCRRRRSCRRGQ